jgi:hypothetical protein
MPSPEANVQAFRNIVEEAIEQNVRGKRYSWSGMHESAEYGGMSYVSVDPHHARPAAMGLHEEHVWGIVQPRRRVGRYVGDLAVISLAGEDATLRRRWDIHTPLQMIHAGTERELREPSEVHAAVDWATSPHIKGRSIEGIAALSEEELARVAGSYALAEHDAGELEADLQAMDRARRQAWQDAQNIVIN